MYFGSVRFFKHLILSVIGFVILVSVSLAVTFGVLYGIEHNKAVTTLADYNEAVSEDKLNIPDNASLDEIYSQLIKKGFTSEDIFAALAKNDSQAMSDIYKHQFLKGEADTQNAYTSLYPDLYVTAPTEFVKKEKTVYFTFDDGPSDNTLQILSILNKYNIKATFFMCGSETDSGKAIMKKVADSGHSIGIHSLSHNYPKIYASVESYLEDFNNTYNNIYNATGVKPDIYRFPGGSINSYDQLIYKQIISEITRRGFVYYDWNVSGEDAAVNADWTSIYNYVVNGIKGKDDAIILLHDSIDKSQTVTVLEDLIIELQKQGYNFDKITNNVMPATFGYIN